MTVLAVLAVDPTGECLGIGALEASGLDGVEELREPGVRDQEPVSGVREFESVLVAHQKHPMLD
jgi:hypothetical protein